MGPEQIPSAGTSRPRPSGTYLPLIGLCSWQPSYKPQGQDHTHPRAELYQEVGTCVPAGPAPGQPGWGGLCRRSGSHVGPIPGSGPRYGLVGERGLCGAAQERLNVLVPAHRHASRLSPALLSGCLPPLLGLSPRSPSVSSIRWKSVSAGTAPGDPCPRLHQEPDRNDLRTWHKWCGS